MGVDGARWNQMESGNVRWSHMRVVIEIKRLVWRERERVKGEAQPAGVLGWVTRVALSTLYDLANRW